MSYRIEDLLETAQQGAPAPRTSTEDIIAGARLIRARRRWAAVAGAGGAALVTVAVVAGLTGAVSRADRPTLPAAPTQAGPSASQVVAKPAERKRFSVPDGFAATVGESRAGRYQLGPVRQVTPGYQVLPVYRDGYTIDVDNVPYPISDADITIYRPGVFDPATFGDEEWAPTEFGPPKKMQVAGTEGIERELRYTVPNMADFRAKQTAQGKDFDISKVKQDPKTRTAYAWEYAENAWATFVPGQSRDPLTRADALSIIDAMKPSAGRTLRMPYTFGWLPGGWRVVGAAQSAPKTDEMVSEVTINGRRLTAADLAEPMDYNAAGSLKIFQGTPKDHNKPVDNEVRCNDSAGYCTMNITKEYFAEFQKVGQGLTMADVRHILRELRFTDLADQAAWKPVK